MKLKMATVIFVAVFGLLFLVTYPIWITTLWDALFGTDVTRYGGSGYRAGRTTVGVDIGSFLLWVVCAVVYGVYIYFSVKIVSAYAMHVLREMGFKQTHWGEWKYDP